MNALPWAIRDSLIPTPRVIMKRKNSISSIYLHYSLLFFATFLLVIYMVSSNKNVHDLTPARTKNVFRGVTVRSKKQILLWNRLPGRMNEILGTGSDGFFRHGCQYTNCFVTQDIEERPIHTFDAVVFNMNVLHHVGPWPCMVQNFTRSENQRFVFFSQEPPMYTWGSSGQVNHSEVMRYDGFFNWSMTYRNDTDIPLIYGLIKRKNAVPELFLNDDIPIAPLSINRASILSRNTNLHVIKETYNRNKSAVVAWMASHCPTHGNREGYIRQLRRYIRVDAYGKCGDLQLENCRQDNTGASPERCYDTLESKYKFYLSFENSICTDYVTEKFFWIMTRNMVPVVYGGADYSRIAPPHSYIDANQFEPKQLAEYLLLLDSNETLYNEYFWWKDYYYVEAGPEQMVKRGFCELCKKLQFDDGKIKIYHEMPFHWLPENQCKNPKIMLTTLD